MKTIIFSLIHRQRRIKDITELQKIQKVKCEVIVILLYFRKQTKCLIKILIRQFKNQTVIKVEIRFYRNYSEITHQTASWSSRTGPGRVWHGRFGPGRAG